MVARYAIVLLAILAVQPGAGAATTVTLDAMNHDYKDSPWRDRSTGGVLYMGLVGSLVVETGDIGFSSFPGASGTYKVEWYVGYENDGRPEYKFSIAGSVKKQGNYNFANGKTSCSTTGATQLIAIDIGEHQINNGDEINIWGKSTYECDPNKGAYCRWNKVVFTLVSGGPPPNTAPTATLSQPTGGSVDYGDSISYSGSASDSEDGALSGSSLTWEYDISGDGLGRSSIGTGTSGSFSAPAHPSGTYPYTLTIYLTATDSGGLTNEKSVNVTVNQPPAGNTAPTATLSQPTGGSVDNGDSISYSGSGSDSEDGSLNGSSLAWEYDISGDGAGRSSIGTGTSGSFSAPAHPSGTYPYTLTIYLTATDSGGLTNEKSVQVTVNQAAVATPTSITSPAPGTDLVEGSTVTLQGLGDNLSWSYDANSDGLGSIAIGTGATVAFTIPTGVSGPRTITITLVGDAGSVNETYNITAAVSDTAPPTIGVTDVGLEGFINDPLVTSVLVGGATVIVANQMFSANIAISGSSASVSISALDPATGATSSRSVDVSAP